MSKSQLRTVSCPHCDAKAKYRIWDTVNTKDSPELKQSVRTGKLFLFTCSRCGATALLTYNFLYHQPEDKFVLFCDAEQTASPLMEKALLGSEAFSGYTKRVVSSYNEVKEKLLLFDACLDDRIIEIMKCGIYTRLSESHPEQHFEEILFSVNAEGERAFLLRAADVTLFVVEFDENAYRAIKDMAGRQIEILSQNRVIIDRVWAQSLIAKQ